MPKAYLIGLDYGSESARGVLLDAETGEQTAYHVHSYRHGIITEALPGSSLLASGGFALQNAPDYLEAAEVILREVASGRHVLGIGIDFTASSPLPALADGRPLSEIFPNDPHAYVKLWKHSGAQRYADSINERGRSFLENFGGRLSGEWLLPKAAQIAGEAPDVWSAAERFIEAGDWLVWRLTGTEARSQDFAAYKAQYDAVAGYPEGVVSDLAPKLSKPLKVGSAAGALTDEWRSRTGIGGPATVAVAVIDSHVVLPAVGATGPGVLVGALGTSAAYLALDNIERPMPDGVEGRAFGAALPGVWCYEAGQPAFGDVLAWFVRTFPRDGDIAKNFASYNEEAARLFPGDSGLVAVDWWNGNRVPYADKLLRGLVAGISTSTTSAEIYRALMDSVCLGARAIVDRIGSSGVPLERIILTSGLAKSNPLVIAIMADALGRTVYVPEIGNPTCVGSAIHGAVAAGVVADFDEGARKFGARRFEAHHPDSRRVAAYDDLYRRYCEISREPSVRHALRASITPALASP